MMNVRVIAVGTLKEKFWREAADEYKKRLSAFCRFEIIQIPEERLPDNPSEEQIKAALKKEALLIEEKLPPKAALVALCVEGKSLPSEGLAELFAQMAVGGQSSVCFVIGSSFGLWADLKDKAALKLSFSPMTFPHQMVRVMLTEQIYRAFCINANRPYHK